MTRIIVLAGGVVSSLGKGVAAAALAALLQARGYRVRLRKLDPYLNVSPGNMSPNQHGEVFVTDDGTEADLDLGHYERFTNVPAGRSDSTTTGRIYMDLLSRERRGDFLGATVQVVPHVTDAIKNTIMHDTDGYDFVLIEVGGTVGDIEALPFFEAVRQLRNELPRFHSVFIHLTLLPWVAAAGELKTKPTQHSVKELRSIGIQPDILLCRSDRPIPESEVKKLSLFCNVRENAVVEALDVSSIYDVPLAYHAAGLDREVLAAFGMEDAPRPDLGRWEEISRRVHNPEGQVSIGIVGKYGLKDAYKSVVEALYHGGIDRRVQVDVDWVDSEELETGDPRRRLASLHGILVPGGFGVRGTEGKINAVRFAREAKTPFLGICLGMQLATIEAARNLVGIEDATSSEFGATGSPIVGLMTEWSRGNAVERRSAGDDLGGTLRLGAYPARLTPGSVIHRAYGDSEISERHRHRYEVNVGYRERLAQKGLRFTGMSPDDQLPEAIELDDHPWFVGVQYHPELKSRPFAPHPLFSAFVGAAVDQSRLV